MIDHVGILVKNLAQSKEFYTQVLQPLGHKVELEYPQGVGFGKNAMFNITEGSSSNTHFAFRANSREEVDRFYETALKIGAKDNGAPGLRSQYGDNYYAAFVYDLDGNNLEVVYRGP
ncbi:hypothetical protein K7432_005017 [Basidiobolus ranarum]|uniref:VOC domain-containing protein n=1 Tax=Basidiobolus ranarum TaxID=34480 RepID=A0ABR2W4R0_9FUNG